MGNFQRVLLDMKEIYLVAVTIRTVQFFIWETIDVGVRTTHIAIASPSDSTL